MKTQSFFTWLSIRLGSPKGRQPAVRQVPKNPDPQTPPHSSQHKLDFMTSTVGVSIVNVAVVVALGALMHNKTRIYIRAHAFDFAFVSLVWFGLV